jgi:hypothetical protein
MTSKLNTLSPARLELVRWAARIGAVTAPALAHREGCAVASARGRLQAAERAGQMLASRPLAGAPTLYVATKAGLGASGYQRLGVSRVSASNAGHMIACAAVAAVLERLYPDHRLMGERELRCEEHDHGAALASATLGWDGQGPELHRPDLVLWPTREKASLPLAIEVELTVKAPRRLLEICRAWARCRCVAGVLYVTAPQVARPLTRAIEQAQAGERIVALELDALLSRREAHSASERNVSSDA